MSSLFYNTDKRRNIQIVFRSDGWVEVRTIGPVVSADYALLKPFLRDHFSYNPEGKCYEVYTENPRFIESLFRKLHQCNFIATQVGRFRFWDKRGLILE